MNSGPTREVKMKKGREDRTEMQAMPVHYEQPPVQLIPTKPAPVTVASLREQLSDTMTIEYALNSTVNYS
jgi:hypothetical protein